MNRTAIAQLFADQETFAGKSVTVAGWARSIRDMKNLGFLSLNDGSCFKSLQVILDKALPNYAEVAGQNVGAGKLDRVKDGVRKATVLNLIAGLAAAVVVWLFAAPITTWFVDPGETAVIAASVQFLNIEAVFILALGVLFVYRNALQGLGNAVVPLISGGVELAMRLAAAILLSRFLGYVGVCLANPVAWTGAAVMLVPAYLAELRRQQNNALARAR